MHNNFDAPQFFLGANTPQGFFSVFNHLYSPKENWFCYILKGGPGTGKSTLMKKAAAFALKKNIETEIIRCSSDPNSLDAVIFPELKKCIVDGTAPHVVEPLYPGATDEIINLGEYWNSQNLKKSTAQIIELCDKNAALHKKSQQFLSAYGSAESVIDYIAQQYTNTEKINKYCKNLSKKLFCKKKSESITHQLRFISSVTPDGYITLKGTLNSLSENTVIIQDHYGTVGTFILKQLKQNARQSGYSTIACLSPFSPEKKLEAFIIPGLKTAFVVHSPALAPGAFKKCQNHKKIHAERFMDTIGMNEHKNIIKFHKKICAELLHESVEALNSARHIHDDIEKIYSQNMNYDKINEIADKLISAIL